MITPNDINTKRFEKSAFGYRPDEVDAFLSQIAGEFAKLQDENAELENKILILAENIEHYRAEEESLKSAIMGAQRLGDSIVRDAKATAENIIAEAQQQRDIALGQLQDATERERTALVRMQQEVSAFKSSLLVMYKQHLEIISELPEVEEPEEEPAPAPAPVQQPEPTPEPTPEQEFAATANFFDLGDSGEEEEEVFGTNDFGTAPAEHTSRFGDLKFGENFELDSGSRGRRNRK